MGRRGARQERLARLLDGQPHTPADLELLRLADLAARLRRLTPRGPRDRFRSLLRDRLLVEAGRSSGDR